MKLICHNIKLCLIGIIGFCLTGCGGREEKAAEVRLKKDKPAIMELISADTSDKVTRELQTFLQKDDELKRWKDHYLVYSPSGDLRLFKINLKAAYPEMKVRLYPADSLFYCFDRSHCSDLVTAGAWENYILTANLVRDTVKQREYLDYHATQYEKWPEIAQGFCHAAFQQLVMFKNGRQLMLVISIPKGKTLEELNPKTTENNPKVKEWNRIMANYQEGIEGTRKGETWVFFESVRQQAAAGNE